MEPFLDEIDIEDEEEDREYLERRARRRERWQREKRERERKRKIMKLSLGLGAAGILLCIVIGVCVKGAVQRGEEETGEKPGSVAAEPGETGTLSAASLETPPETVSEGTEGENQGEGISPDSQQETPEEEEPQVYKFEETTDTKSIYSEEVISPHAILVNAETNTIVAAKAAYDRISPASMTKVLTVLVAAEAISEENLEDTFTVTAEITDYAYVNDCSIVGFSKEEVVTVRDLFYGTILPSGADAAVALATYVAGSHEAFVERMNQKLEELGLADSAHFTNCVGLYDENHYCTVYDMAVIMKAAMENPWCREVLSAHTYNTTPTAEHPEGLLISNWFLRRIEDKDTGGLVVGGKTGFVAQSGSCAVSYEEYADGTPYICVTAGSTSSWRCIYDQVEIYNSYISQ